MCDRVRISCTTTLVRLSDIPAMVESGELAAVVDGMEEKSAGGERLVALRPALLSACGD